MTRTPTVASAAVAAVAVLATGCSSSGAADSPRVAPTPGAGPSSASQAPDEMLATRTTIRRVSGGRLQATERAALRDRVTAVLDDWFDAAYLGGDYPRTDFDDAFAVFTPQARTRAVEDRRLMSNAAVGTTTYDVRALARRAQIDVLAVGSGASGVTVQFRLGMARAGESGAEVRERVSGHLYLTRHPGAGWQVFGYDVQRGVLA